MNILNFFTDWQVKIAIILVVISGLFFWHKYEVKVAVNSALAEQQLEYQKEKFKLLDKANDATIALRNQLEKQNKETQRELQNVNTKHNDLLEWVRNLPSTSSSSSIAGSSQDSKGSREDIIGELRRKHAIDLAEYSKTTEELKTWLNACYRDYEVVEKSLNDFKAKNSTIK